MSKNLSIPEDEEGWIGLAQSRKLQETSVHELPNLTSASNIAEDQFCCLRVIWSEEKDQNELFKYFDRALFEEAKAKLKHDAEWNNYVNLIRAKTRRGELYGDLERQREIGAFQVIHSMQDRILFSKEFEDLEFKDTNPKYAATSKVMDRVNKKVPDRGKLAKAMSALSISEHDTQDQITPEAQKKEDNDALPWSALTHSYLQEIPPDGRRKAVQDEKLVEEAFHTFAQTLLARHLSPTSNDKVPEWSPAPLRLNCHGWIALTDGALKAANGGTRAIVEVKPIIRQPNRGKIRAQESGQMAAWISHYPLEYNKLGGKDDKMWRLLISQDRSDIYLTIAIYDKAYEHYIGNIPDDPFITKKAEDSTAAHGKKLSLLHMIEHGPYHIQDPNDMESLGRFMVTIVLQLVRDFKPPTESLAESSRDIPGSKTSGKSSAGAQSGSKSGGKSAAKSTAKK